jgi:hypothetical protein
MFDYKTILSILLLLMITSACGIESDEIIEPTTTQVQLPTISPIPIFTVTAPSDLDISILEHLLVQDGDLPAGLTAAQFKATPPGMFRDVKYFKLFAGRSFEKGGESYGGVSLFIYDDEIGLDIDYNVIIMGFGPDRDFIETFGEKAHQRWGDIAFVRCNTIVHIRAPEPVGAINYAKRLDNRIEQQVCPYQ